MAIVVTILVVLLVLAAIALAVSASRRRGEPSGPQLTDTDVRPPPTGEVSPTRGDRPVPGSRAARRRQGKP
jgi:hypothetical protein